MLNKIKKKFKKLVAPEMIDKGSFFKQQTKNNILRISNLDVIYTKLYEAKQVKRKNHINKYTLFRLTIKL